MSTCTVLCKVKSLLNLCSLLAATKNLGNYNAIYFSKYGGTISPKSQDTQRQATNGIEKCTHGCEAHNKWTEPDYSNHK